MLNDSSKKAKTSFIQDIFLSTYKKKMLRAGFELSVKQKENEKHTLMNWKDRGSELIRRYLCKRTDKKIIND